MAAVQGGRDVPLCRWGRGKMAWREIPLIYLEGHGREEADFFYTSAETEMGGKCHLVTPGRMLLG